MAFFKYTEKTCNQFDQRTQAILDELVARFGIVELNQVRDSSEWCVRVMCFAPDGEQFPLAAIGASAFNAAQRLLRMVQFREAGRKTS